MKFKEKIGLEGVASNYFRTRTGPEQKNFDPRSGVGQKGPRPFPHQEKRTRSTPNSYFVYQTQNLHIIFVSFFR